MLQYKTYALSDIAVLYNNYLYINIPYDLEYDTSTQYLAFDYLAIEFNETYSELVDKGFSAYSIEFQIINNTALPLDKKILLYLGYGTGNIALNIYVKTFEEYINESNNSIVTIENSVDVGSLILDMVAKDYSSKSVQLVVNPEYVLSSDCITGIKMKYVLYTTSEKPILKMFTEPAYGIIAGLWSTLVAVYHRIRQYALSFFGGFSVSALFTGLIGDPTTALIITAAVVAVFFFALARPAPRRRHD